MYDYGSSVGVFRQSFIDDMYDYSSFNQSPLKEILFWGNAVIEQFSFYNNTNLEKIVASDIPGLEADLNNVFSYCSKLTEIQNLDSWNAGNTITILNSAFAGCEMIN